MSIVLQSFRVATLFLALLLAGHISAARSQTLCSTLDGAYLSGLDSQRTYLGFFGNEFASESIYNRFGNFGSEFGASSVRNRFGAFGSQTSSTSHLNPVATRPPIIVRRGVFIGYLTVNRVLTPAISLAEVDATCGTRFIRTAADRAPGEIPPAPPTGGGGSTFTLQVSVSGAGRVVSSPSGIDCPGACGATAPAGLQVTLNATPESGWRFDGWGGGACNGTGTCSFAMSQNRSVTATFTQAAASTATLSVSVNGSGSVTSNPVGINCPADCQETYSSGTMVTLSPSPASGWQFQGWGGSCSGSGSCQVAMSAARSVTANFQPSPAGGVTTAQLSGLWYNPMQSGHGFGITAVVPGVLALTWYTYTPDGGPTWVAALLNETAPGEYRGNAGFYQGMRFGEFSPAANRTFDWGEIIFRFSSCSAGTVTYNSTLIFSDGRSFGSGTIPIERLAGVDGSTCGASPQVRAKATTIDRGISGLWYNEGQTGHGFEFTVVAPGVAAVTWYTYTRSGFAIWVAALLEETAPNVLSGSAFYYDGMRFGTFNPAENNAFPWGTLSFEFQSCDRATVTYNGTLTFQDGESFGQGSIPLRKLASFLGVGCAAGTHSE